MLSVARSTGAAFEWHDHVQHALAAGLPQQVVDGIANGQAERLAQPWALLHAMLARTLSWQPLADELQERAVAQWGREGLVEIVVLSGFYQMFAAINQGFAIASAGG